MNSDERLSIWQRLGSILGLTDNQMSHSDLRSRLAYLLKERFGEDAYLEDVYSSTIVYELGGQTYRMKYLSDARSGKVTLIDDLPYPVMKTTTYKPARNAGKPNQSKETEMDKAQMVEFLTNSTCCWDESDQEVLNELSDEKLGLLVSNYKESEATKQVVNEATKGFEHDGVKFEFDKDELKFNAKVPDNFKKKSSSTGEEDGEDEEDMEAETKNKRKEPMTEEQWMQVAPPSVREDLAYARNQKATRKSELIGKITANVADDQKERVVNRLKDRPLDELEDLAVLAPQPKDEPIATPTANYRGLGIPTPRVDNQDDKDDFLPLPTMDFTSKN